MTDSLDNSTLQALDRMHGRVAEISRQLQRAKLDVEVAKNSATHLPFDEQVLIAVIGERLDSMRKCDPESLVARAWAIIELHKLERARLAKLVAELD